jgi:hypothetical protein
MVLTVLALSRRTALLCAFEFRSSARGAHTTHSHRRVPLRELASIALETGATLRTTADGSCPRRGRLTPA